MSHLLNTPSAYAKVRAEVDEVLGKEPIKFEHLSKLPYINAVLRETLRITPSVPLFTVEAFKETTIGTGDKTYKIPINTGIQVLVAQMHRDTKVWGEDVSAVLQMKAMDGRADFGFFPLCRQMFSVLRGCWTAGLRGRPYVA